MTKSEKESLVEMISEIKQDHAIHTEKLDRVIKSIDSLNLVLLGDGSEQKPGVHMRVDRLEQKERLKSKVLWTVAGSTLGLLVKTVWGWVK